MRSPAGWLSTRARHRPQINTHIPGYPRRSRLWSRAELVQTAELFAKLHGPSREVNGRCGTCGFSAPCPSWRWAQQWLPDPLPRTGRLIRRGDAWGLVVLAGLAAIVLLGLVGFFAARLIGGPL